MLRGLEQSSYHKRGKLGTRTQLINIRTKKLEMDLKYEGIGNYFHVLNAVSSGIYLLYGFCRLLSRTNSRKNSK